jgi:ribosomal protein L20A (L18A)
VSCYRKHDNECTEDFYKSRVNSILQLEVKEKSEAMKATLRRFYHNSRENADSHAHEDLCSELRSQTRIPREELLKILSVLEQCENNVDDDSLDQLLLSRFPFLQSKISRLLVSEAEKTQLAEWLVEPWFPWWRTEYCSPKEEVDAEEDELSSCKTTKHLDDRLLRIPPFHTLSPSTTVSTSKVQPSLEYNLVNILYAIVWTLRSFHGAHNAVEQDATAAASVLMQASTVLSQDARFTTLEQVLIECTRFSAQYASSSDTSATCGDFHASYLTSWDVLALDVALLCSNYRYVARAILEARDIIKIAISHSPKDMKDNQTTLHRSRKKLKYYLSWSKEYGEIIVSLSDGIRTWIQDWSSTSHSVLSTNELILPPLQLNTNKNQYKHNQP